MFCNGKIEFNRDTNSFYLVHEHNKICDEKNIKIYDNYADIENSFKEFNSFKKELFDFLNKNPLINYQMFNKTACKYYLKYECNFTLKK